MQYLMVFHDNSGYMTASHGDVIHTLPHFLKYIRKFNEPGLYYRLDERGTIIISPGLGKGFFFLHSVHIGAGAKS